MKTIIYVSLCSMLSLHLSAQGSGVSAENSKENKHFERVPDYPERLTTGTSLARMIDGLGFRYYWGSRDLTPEDLAYRPSEEARSTLETLSHIHYMVLFIENIVKSEVTVFPEPALEVSYQELRASTLESIQSISAKLSNMDAESFSKLEVKIKAGQDEMQFPIWHLLHGPIGDTYYHLGQVVSFRRTTGNPIDPNVQPFFGKRMTP
ncbi:MAG: hypothetical protein KTR30_14705 [Saprospiraceae bacterium]|nr:hypothetical protein [Saprospiraceae bacterium]